MARRNPISEHEKQICRRLLEFRLSIKLTRKALADELEINPKSLESYETGRVPLLYLFAAKFCRRFEVNPVWLFDASEIIHIEGREITHLLNPNEETEIRKRSLFSFIYSDIIKLRASQPKPKSQIELAVEKIKPQLAGKFIGVKFFRASQAIGIDTLQKMLNETLPPLISTLPPDLRLEFYRHLIGSFHEFERLHTREITTFAKHRKPTIPANESAEVKKTSLTNKAESLTSSAVQSVLPKLIQRLKRATAARGSKSELAKWLGVHRQSVTDWLSGKQEPGGEITLQLLHWVEQQERQK